jgi:small conductance mechanosensitive channel
MQLATLADLETACGVDDPSRICIKVYQWTGNDVLAGLSEWVIDRPLRVVIIVVLAWFVTRVSRRTARAIGDRIRNSPAHPNLQRARADGPRASERDLAEAARAPARADAIESVLKNLASVIVWVIATLLILGEFEINLAPLIAGAGIAGIAIGFGAQSIVADFLAGTFMLLEDQYGIGDVIEIDGVTGDVENISLRTTKLRDVGGTVWHIPNSEIKRVGNHSQLWSQAVIDVRVGLDADLRAAMRIMDDVADKLWHECHPDTGLSDIIEDPKVLGVQEIGESSLTLRMLVKTDPAAQYRVQRELRLRLVEAFTEAGINIPMPQRTIHVASGEPIVG